MANLLVGNRFCSTLLNGDLITIFGCNPTNKKQERCMPLGSFEIASNSKNRCVDFQNSVVYPITSANPVNACNLVKLLKQQRAIKTMLDGIKELNWIF